MLSFILGRAGSGKTTAVLQKIAQAAGEKKRVLLIVPEQFSFEMEKAVARLVPNGAQQVEVYSFTRLCHKIFADCGGMAGEVVTEPAKQILMSLTLGQVRDQLELYSRQAKNPAFVGTMLRQIDEFKNAGVLPDQLRLFPARPACRSWRRRQRRCPGSTSPIRRCWKASFRTRRTGSCAAVRCWRAGDIFGTASSLSIPS